MRETEDNQNEQMVNIPCEQAEIEKKKAAMPELVVVPEKDTACESSAPPESTTQKQSFVDNFDFNADRPSLVTSPKLQ